MAEYAGNRWYKCDLHLHTASSVCYTEKHDTAQDWVAKALSCGLDAAAVTDHNDYRGISAVMEEGARQGLSVFPGVEITCDSSKIHMLILFDTDKTAENVRDFLNRCDIDSDHTGDPDGTSLSVFEVCEVAKKRGALVIAAHIDEFNSISSMNPVNLEKLLTGGYIDAVQVSNVPVWRKLKSDRDTESMQQVLQEKYGPDATPQITDRWRKCYNRAEELGIPMLAFSDNPAADGDSRHGLWGIGSEYTWIQMDDVVSLESIRQSLLTADDRIRMMYDSAEMPRTEPDFWICSLEVRKTQLNPHRSIRLEFHPQLNCIIGGKGSGKSALVRLLQGVFDRLSDGYVKNAQQAGSLLKDTMAQQARFYRQTGEDGYGVFREDSEIEIVFSWYGCRYRMLVTDIRGIGDQKTAFFRMDPETGEEVPEDFGELVHSPFLCPQVFIQRQIHEITVTPGALLDQVDKSIYDMHILQSRRAYYLERLVNLSAQIQAADRFLESGDRVNAELSWLEELSRKNVQGDLGKDISSMIRRRKSSAEMIGSFRRRAGEIREGREQMLREYEECLEEIRRMRMLYIGQTLTDDGNYKMELKPMASRDSFRKMLKKTLPGSSALMADDARKLEEALFMKKGGIRKYTQLLLAARGLGEETDSIPEQPFSAYFTHLIRHLEDDDFERMLLFRPEDELDMFYHPNGVKRFFPMTTASSGEKATAVFSFVLSGSTVPLIIDQPEDDMDNRVIYEEIVRKLKKAKQKRQMIIVTHNANICTNAAPEMIISMDSKSEFVRVRMQGSVDNEEIRNEICDVIEGTRAAFVRRAKKYHL